MKNFSVSAQSTIAYDPLVHHLAKYGYFPLPHTTGMWKHSTRKTIFCLCVDDFGVKTFSTHDTKHLLDSLRDLYKVSTNMNGRNYCGLTLDWNYEQNLVDISMPGYIDKVLDKFLHATPTKPRYAPHKWTQPIYVQKQQLTPDADQTQHLDAKETKTIQAIVDSLLHYSRAIESPMLVALNEIASTQAKPTEHTKAKSHMLLDYAASHKDAKIRYHASDMILHVKTDAAYLVMPKAQSQIAGYYYLSSNPPPSSSRPQPTPNGPILIECKKLRT